MAVTIPTAMGPVFEVLESDTGSSPSGRSVPHARMAMQAGGCDDIDMRSRGKLRMAAATILLGHVTIELGYFEMVREAPGGKRDPVVEPVYAFKRRTWKAGPSVHGSRYRQRHSRVNYVARRQNGLA